MFKDDTVYNIVNNCIGNKCSNCGECCVDFIPLTKREVKNIKSYIRKNNIKENVYIEDGNFDNRCPFYVKDSCKHCSIYPVRPEICKTFKCCQSAHTIADNKVSLSYDADYNRFRNNSFCGTMVSLHSLFYDNGQYEAEAIFLMCNGNMEMFKKYASVECLNRYTFENPQGKEVK